jgi:hypothetical protein
MALTDFPISHVPALFWRTNSGNAAFQAIVLDAAGERATLVIHAPATGNITEVGFRCNGLSSSGDVDVRIETVDATNGQPSGTLWGTNTNGTVTVNAAGTWFTATLTASASVTKGEVIAVVITNTTGNYQLSAVAPSIYGFGFPYGATFLGSVWTKGTNIIAAALNYGGTYPWIPGVRPYSGLNTPNYNNASSPAERGLKFTLGMSVRAIGCYLYADIDAAAEIRLYDSGTNLVANGTIVLDSDIRGQTTPGSNEYLFPAPITLSASADYRLVLAPTSVSNVGLADYDVAAAAILSGQPGGGNFVYTSRPAAGSWTDSTTKRPLSMGLIIDQIDIGSGGGGMIVHPGMAGGLRG